jgi:Beta-galactosidase
MFSAEKRRVKVRQKLAFKCLVKAARPIPSRVITKSLRYGNRNGMLLKHLVKCLAVLMTGSAASASQDGPAHPDWPGRGQLFVGACYQPADRSREQIDSDIAVMKRAGFNVVRMGDLSWGVDIVNENGARVPPAER